MASKGVKLMSSWGLAISPVPLAQFSPSDPLLSLGGGTRILRRSACTRSAPRIEDRRVFWCFLVLKREMITQPQRAGGTHLVQGLRMEIPSGRTRHPHWH
jgi:hypothetical protein